MKKKLFIVVMFLIHSSLHGQDIKNQVGVEKAVPFQSTNVTLKPSWIKHREDLNITFLKSLDPDRLLHNFRITAGLPSEAKPLEGWEAPDIGLRGHFVGHYLSAVSHLVERYKDPQLNTRLEYLIDELYKCQQVNNNGYLSAFPDKDFDILESKFTGVWAPYYTYHKIMQGLLDTYIHTNNPKAYEILLGMAAYIENRMSKLSRESIERMLYTVDANPQNEAGAMNEVLYKLYKVSNDPKHLALAKLFDPDWFAIPLSQNEDILSGLHSNTHLVLVNGFTQRYAITQEMKYHNAAINFWNMLVHNHAYANGSSSGPRPNAVTKTSVTAEHWGVPGQLSNTLSKEIAESCVSHNTQKLTACLFTWTANPQYADSYMNMFYNAVLPTQSDHTGSFVYHLPLGSPRNKKYLKDNDFACCSGSGVEAYSQLNQGIYYHNDTTLWVNLYIPSEVYWKEKNIKLMQNSKFPKDSIIDLTISTKRKSNFSLKLLVPSWAKNTTLYINDEKQHINAHSMSYLDLNRNWNDKDKVKLVFQYDFHLKPMPDNSKVFAIYYGPILLAFESKTEVILKGDMEDILKNISPLNSENAIFLLKNNGKEYLLRPLYDIDTETYGAYATIRNY
nr:beta-L-arabinofuranosidase domain-containing protein [Bacteroides intestinalis]